MGLFGGLFDKKSCSVCGGEIGLFGNRKLEDGNLCKNCAAKLSPWFSDRRRSTVEQIRAQLAYREQNKAAVAAFHTTASYGEDMKVLLDEDARKFTVTRASSLSAANPDILDFAAVTGVDLDIKENRREATRENAEGKSEPYNPARFDFSYDFYVLIRVNHPYFDELRFQLNSSNVQTTTVPVPAIRKPDPEANPQYARFRKMGEQIVAALSEGRRQIREEKTPKTARTCPACGASTVPDANGCCEYCGTALI